MDFGPRIEIFNLEGAGSAPVSAEFARGPVVQIGQEAIAGRAEVAASCTCEGVSPTLPQGGKTMHTAHRKAAEQHDLAAQAHRTAAEHKRRRPYHGGVALGTSAGVLRSRLQACKGSSYQVRGEIVKFLKCLSVITTDRITKITHAPPSCTISPPTRIVPPRKPMRNKITRPGRNAPASA
jgi:hypothetical protein